MQRKSNAVVFLGMVYPGGGIRHLTLLGCELFKACSADIDFHYASITREADSGCWRLVRSVVPEDLIIEETNFNSLVKRIVDLRKDYSHVIVHTGGGWGQTKHFMRAIGHLHRSERRRIHLVATTHAFRIDSSLRIPMSIFQYILYCRYYDKVVFQCQYAADRFVGGNRLIKKGKGVVIPLGCEPFGEPADEAPPGIAAQEKLLEVLQDDKKFKFVYLAGFRPGKMHVWLVRALAPVLKRHPSTYVLFCGTGDQAVMEATKTKIRLEGLSDKIMLTGQVARNEVPWLLAHCDCAVVPSRAETFGHNFLEPMFAGLPVLGTRVGIGRDIIKDGETGYGFSLTRPASVQSAAERLLLDVAIVHEMGRRARRLVENDFTHAAVAKRLLQVYCNVLKAT